MRPSLRYLVITAALLFMARPAGAALIEITSANLLGDAVTLDFESAAAGAISGTSSVFTSFGIESVWTVGTFTNSGDFLDAGVFGQALGATGGGTGTLSILAPSGPLADQSLGAGFHLDLIGTATQFGFRVIDQFNFDLTIRTFLSGSQTNSLLITLIALDNVTPNPIRYFSADSPFDAVEIITGAGAQAGWAVDDLTLAGRGSPNPVPEPATLSLLGLGLAGTAVRCWRQRKAS